MTCIVGVVSGGRICMGGDSAGVAGWDLNVRSDPKVFQNGPFLMGFTSSFRMGQLLRWAFTPPHHESGVDDEKYMVTTFVDAVRKCLKDGGYATKEKDAEAGGTFLVGYKGKLFQIDDDYQVEIAADGFGACGCGASAARGSLHTSARLIPDVPAEQRTNWALEAAERCSAGVRGPFVIMTQEASQ